MARFMRIFFLIEAGLAGLCYAVVALAMISDVFAREFFNYSIYGVQRAAVLFVIATAYFGLGLATSQNQHLRPRFADGWAPARYQSLVTRLGDLLSAIAFATMGYFSFLMVKANHEWDETIPVILIPLWTVQWIMPYGFFSAAIRFVVFFLRPDLKPLEQVAEQ